MRTFEEIKNEITLEYQLQLPQLASASATAIYKLWINVMASAIFTFEQIFEKDKAALVDLTERRRYGTVEWYASEALKFQLGDQLVFNSQTGQYYYAIEDQSSQIIARSAVIEDNTSGVLVMKVAKLYNGQLTALSPAEILAFSNYINEIKVAGTDIDVISLQPDIITIDAEVFYDGNLLQTDVENAIFTALDEFKLNAPFNGVILKNDLIEVVRNITGIDDVLFINITGQSSTGTPVQIVRDYPTTSGYFIFPIYMVNSWTFTPRYQ